VLVAAVLRVCGVMVVLVVVVLVTLAVETVLQQDFMVEMEFLGLEVNTCQPRSLLFQQLDLFLHQLILLALGAVALIKHQASTVVVVAVVVTLAGSPAAALASESALKVL
jgi:hypothetical protein